MSVTPFDAYKSLGDVLDVEGFGVVARDGRVAFMFGWEEPTNDIPAQVVNKHVTIVLPNEPEIIEQMMGEIIKLWPAMARRLITKGESDG